MAADIQFTSIDSGITFSIDDEITFAQRSDTIAFTITGVTKVGVSAPIVAVSPTEPAPTFTGLIWVDTN